MPHPAAYAKASENRSGEQSRKKGYINTFATPCAAAGLASEGFLRAAFGGTATDADITEYMKVLDGVTHWIPEAANVDLAAMLVPFLHEPNRPIGSTGM